MPYEPFVDDPVQKLPNIAEQTDRAVAGRVPLVCSLFRNGSHQIVGTKPVHQLCICSRKSFAPGPRCFSLSSVIPQGPGAFFCFFSASSSSQGVRHSVMHGPKPALGVFWSTARVWVLTSLTLSAEGEAVLSSSKTLARTFAASFPVTAPFVVCSVVLLRFDLSPFHLADCTVLHSKTNTLH